MDLRCLVFSSDKAAAQLICHVLAEMGAEAEHCPEAVAALERVASEPFQIVIVDWDQQPEAEFFLKAARGRKASDRPLALAVVSEEAGVPKALQAGANSILRKPFLVNHVKDTLQTARSLLKARQDSAIAMAAGAAASPSAAAAAPEAASETHLRAGDFLQSTGAAPATQIDTESEMQKSIDRSAAAEINPLRDLEPMAAAVRQEPAPPLPPSAPAPNEPRGLQWYLNQRGVSAPPSPHQPIVAPTPHKPELLGFDQAPTSSDWKTTSRENYWDESPLTEETEGKRPRENMSEADAFAFVGGVEGEPHEPGERRFRLGKGTIAVAVALAGMAIAAAPQAPWHAQARALWGKGRQVVHGWLNPQPVAPAQAPAAHEDFGRAGDEYKLPVAETIPDATTDPSQIRVVPMVDPTKKPPPPDPNLAPIDGASTNPADGTQVQEVPSPAVPAQATQEQGSSVVFNQSPQAAPPTQQSKIDGTAVAIPNIAPAHSDPFATASVPAQPAPPRNPQPRPVSTTPGPPIPSSLKSQMASPMPDASGNKAPETALPSIEPVAVPEAAERGLLAAQPPVPYPATAKGQQGSVVLQVLIGRDGTVQDAKFLQGSLAFARTAIDGVKQWQFKPYIMNGRPVSVQTLLTLSFKPGQ